VLSFSLPSMLALFLENMLILWDDSEIIGNCKVHHRASQSAARRFRPRQK